MCFSFPELRGHAPFITLCKPRGTRNPETLVAGPCEFSNRAILSLCQKTFRYLWLFRGFFVWTSVATTSNGPHLLGKTVFRGFFVAFLWPSFWANFYAYSPYLLAHRHQTMAPARLHHQHCYRPPTASQALRASRDYSVPCGHAWHSSPAQISQHPPGPASMWTLPCSASAAYLTPLLSTQTPRALWWWAQAASPVISAYLHTLLLRCRHGCPTAFESARQKQLPSPRIVFSVKPWKRLLPMLLSSDNTLVVGEPTLALQSFASSRCGCLLTLLPHSLQPLPAIVLSPRHRSSSALAASSPPLNARWELGASGSSRSHPCLLMHSCLQLSCITQMGAAIPSSAASDSIVVGVRDILLMLFHLRLPPIRAILGSFAACWVPLAEGSPMLLICSALRKHNAQQHSNHCMNCRTPIIPVRSSVKGRLSV